MERVREYGFTLLEILVVIAIIAILAATIIVSYSRFINQAETSVAMQERDRMMTEIEGYFLDGKTIFKSREYQITASPDFADFDISIGHNFISNHFTFQLTDQAETGSGPSPIKKNIFMKEELRNAIRAILGDVLVADKATDPYYPPGTLVIDIADFNTHEVTFVYHYSDEIQIFWIVGLVITVV